MSLESINLGIVVIGRNEEANIQRCLNSLNLARESIVYVDSGSTDASVDLAKKIGVQVLRLEEGDGFSAARGRQTGFDFLLKVNPSIEYVQFIDADCELNRDWLDTARSIIEKDPSLAIVYGIRSEKHPNRSIYNLLCDIEWKKIAGRKDECGGDFMIRVSAMTSAGGFDVTLVAGEEPELCHRLKQENWSIKQLMLPMTFHDANIQSFLQWGRRTKRAGFAFAYTFLKHRSDFNLRQVLSIVFWAFLIPSISFLAYLIWGWNSLILLLVYPLQVTNIARRHQPMLGFQVSFRYAFYTMLGKFFEGLGLLEFLYQKVSFSSPKLIEYK